jgi:hypothetical protein
VIVDADFLRTWDDKGHVYGECMSHPNTDLMYVYIPKNASSWTKPNLKDLSWEFYNYHKDQLDKHALVVLRDPVERWLSGIAEYLTLYHPTLTIDSTETLDIIFDRVCFDDHTEQQIKFIHGLDTDRCTFFRCDSYYREDFSTFLDDHGIPNRYHKYEFQHVSESSPDRRRFQEIFRAQLEKSKYLTQIKNYYEEDYRLMDSVEYYGSR